MRTLYPFLLFLLAISMSLPTRAQQTNNKKINNLRTMILEAQREAEAYTQDASDHPGAIADKLRQLISAMKEASAARDEAIKALQSGGDGAEAAFTTIQQEKIQPAGKKIRTLRQELKALGYKNLWSKKDEEKDAEAQNTNNVNKPKQNTIEEVEVLNPRDFEKWLRENRPAKSTNNSKASE